MFTGATGWEKSARCQTTGCTETRKREGVSHVSWVWWKISTMLMNNHFPLIYFTHTHTLKGSSLQCRCNQQGSELRRREQHSARLKERLTQLAERHRERGACKDLCLTISLTLNVPSHILSHSIFLSKCLLILNPHTILPLSFYLPIVMISAQRERASRAFAFGWGRLWNSPAVVGLMSFDTSRHTSVLIEVASNQGNLSIQSL